MQRQSLEDQRSKESEPADEPEWLAKEKKNQPPVGRVIEFPRTRYVLSREGDGVGDRREESEEDREGMTQVECAVHSVHARPARGSAGPPDGR